MAGWYRKSLARSFEPWFHLAKATAASAKLGDVVAGDRLDADQLLEAIGDTLHRRSKPLSAGHDISGCDVGAHRVVDEAFQGVVGNVAAFGNGDEGAAEVKGRPLSNSPLPRENAYAMIKRRARAAGIETRI